ncbi:MAG TPA: hypothetical protein PLL89_04665 [bacterium]|nr:hypothetical protein [bacterium]
MKLASNICVSHSAGFRQSTVFVNPERLSFTTVFPVENSATGIFNLTKG